MEDLVRSGGFGLRPGASWPWLLPVGLTAVLGAALVILVVLISRVAPSGRPQRLAGDLNSLRGAIEFRLEGSQQFLELLAAERSAGLSPVAFDKRVWWYVEKHPEVLGVLWVNEAWVITDVAPDSVGAHLVGARVARVESAAAARQAQSTRQSSYTGPFNGDAGEPCFEQWTAVYKDDTFLGFLAASFSCQRLLAHSVSADLLQTGYRASLLTSAGALVADQRPPQDAAELTAPYDSGREAPESGPQPAVLKPSPSRAAERDVVSGVIDATRLRGVRVRLELPREPDIGRRIVWILGLCILLTFGLAIALWSLQRQVVRSRRAVDERSRVQERLLSWQRSEQARVEAELAKVEGELVSSTKLATIGRLSGQLAHDLRTPLATIRNAVYLLRRRAGTGAGPSDECLGRIEDEVQVCSMILTKLLESAKTDDPHPERVRLDAVLDEAVARHSEAGDIAWDVRVEPRPLEILADRLQLRRVLDNLLENACDANGAGGRIDVVAEANDGVLRLSVRDSGPGIPPEKREEVFEPLYTTKATGTGLGLAICRQIIEKHGGSIRIGESKGAGAVVEIELPIEPAEPTSPRA